jgi:hypothetical protein
LKECMHVDGFLVEPGKYSKEILRSWSATKLQCQHCRAAVLYRHGIQVTPHFAHRAGKQCEYREPETMEHAEGKRLLKMWLEKVFPANVTIQEYFVKEIQQRADILTIFPDGHRLGIEIQCSPIPEDVLKKRMEGYEQAGIAQLWILGDSVFKGRVINRFRLHAWETILMKRQDRRMYLLDALDRRRLVSLVNIEAIRGKKTVYTTEERTGWELDELGVSRDGKIVLSDGTPIALKRQSKRRRLTKKSQAPISITNVESEQLKNQRERDFETNPLKAFAISRFGHYLSHPVVNQYIDGDHLFLIDHRLWQSNLFLTEIHKIYQRRSVYGTGTKIPTLFIKHILVKDTRFPERPFQIVLEKYVNHQLDHQLRYEKDPAPSIKTIHELVYEYFCRLEALGFLRNITPNRERITQGGKMFGRFEVLFDQFCPERFGETEQEVQAFFRNHSLRYVKNRWFDISNNKWRPLDI